VSEVRKVEEFKEVRMLAPGQVARGACPLPLEGGFPTVKVELHEWFGPGPIVGVDVDGLAGHFESAPEGQLDAFGAWLGAQVAGALKRRAFRAAAASPLREEG